jgi:hypothetical protein
MGRDPVPGDVDAARDPDALVGKSVIDKPFERCGAAGPAGEPTMQADRHHARAGLALPIEHIETVLQVGEELVAELKPCGVANRLSLLSKA